MTTQEKKIIIISFIVFVVASIFSVGYHHFDEHFQILEFAGLKLNLTSAVNLPWEYHCQMRPAFQPFIAFCLYNFFGLFGLNNPFIIAFIFRLLSAVLTFYSIWLLYRVFKDQIHDTVLKKWYLILSFLLWFAIYNGVRFSSENWSGIAFIITFSLFFIIQKRNAIFFVCIGCGLGLTFLFRYQAGFLIMGFLLWMAFIKKEKVFNLLLIMFGLSLLIFIGILIDHWFYGEWTISFWHYFEQNILQDKVSNFGVHPWWWYFEKFFMKGIPPFSLLFIISLFVLLIYRPKSPVLWSITPFLIVHFLIGHKEIRFLFPMICFLPIISILAMEAIQNKYIPKLTSSRFLQVFMKLFFIVNFIALAIVSLQPADNQIPLYNSIYKNYKEPVTLYYINENPYKRVLDIYFYRRKNLSVNKIESLKDIDYKSNNKNLIVFTNRDIPLDFGKNHKLVYSSFPDYLLAFNFNNWLSRTKAWYVYEL